jgi:hypothetical protein
MRRTVLLLTTMAVALIVASGIALAQSQLDQQQPLDDGGYAVLNQTTTPDLAQTFTAGVTGTLDKVSLDVGCCADDSGNIGGTPPANGVIVWLVESIALGCQAASKPTQQYQRPTSQLTVPSTG